jgi:putative oxidoreductase
MEKEITDFCKKCGIYHGDHTIGPLIGRVLLGFIFMFAGIGKIFNFNAALLKISDKGLDESSHTFLIIAMILEFVGGLMILLGLRVRVAVILLFLFLLPVTFVMHGFWNYDAIEYMNQFTHFFKNLGLMGGLILLASFGPGKWSLDARRHAKCSLEDT